MINNSLFTTGKDDWETPQGFFDNLNTVNKNSNNAINI